MSYGEKQKKEIETIRERKILLNLSDADCDRVSKLCGRHDLTVSQLIENFIGDLVGGTYSNGSDERDLAELWFKRCGFGMFLKEKSTLLKWVIDDERVSVEEFLDLLDNIEITKRDLENHQKNPSEYDEEEIEFAKIDLEDWEREFDDYKSRYMKENPKANWEEEIEKVKKWFRESAELKSGNDSK